MGADIGADLLFGMRRRGPGPGGGRSHGRPWRGVVEQTPHVWVTWIVQASKALGKCVPEAIYAGGERVELVAARLTFGLRYYFICPGCERRCEALFFLPHEVGCRKCLHLGYASQMTRPLSVWRLLDDLFGRHPLWGLRYEDYDNPVVREVVAPVRRHLLNKIEDMMGRMEVRNEG